MYINTYISVPMNICYIYIFFISILMPILRYMDRKIFFIFYLMFMIGLHVHYSVK